MVSCFTYSQISQVHIGSYALAHLAKQAGMTAGHEPDEEREETHEA